MIHFRIVQKRAQLTQLFFAPIRAQDRCAMQISFALLCVSNGSRDAFSKRVIWRYRPRSGQSISCTATVQLLWGGQQLNLAAKERQAWKKHSQQLTLVLVVFVVQAPLFWGESPRRTVGAAATASAASAPQLTGVAVQPKPLAIFKQQLDAGRSLFNKLLGKFSHSKTHS